MGFFNIGKGKETIPPDVGKEISEEKGESEPIFSDEDSQEEIIDAESEKKHSLTSKKLKEKDGKSVGMPADIQIEKINAKIEILDSWIKGSQEKFSAINEKIGEIRSSLVKNEKELSKAVLISSKASDLVKEVEPEKLAANYLKINARIESLFEKIASIIEYSTLLTNEIKELKRKSDLFVGTESLLSLNEETKKSLIDIQKINSKVKLNADKAEQYFIELRGLLSENQKLEQKVNLMDATVLSMKREMQRLNLDLSNVIMKKEFDSFSKAINNRISNSEFFMRDLSKIDEQYARLGKIIETTLGIAQKNKRDIENISIFLGRDEGEKSNKYAEQMAHVLNIVDKLSEQIDILKSKGVNSKGGVRQKGDSEENNPSSTSAVVDDMITQINSMISKGEEFLKNGNTQAARDIYFKINDSYNILSEESRAKVYTRFAKFYNSLEFK